MITSEEALRRLTIGDPAYCRAVMATEPGDSNDRLDARSVALLRLGASIRAGSVGPMLQQRVGDALEAGVGFDEIVASLAALAPTVGIERVVAVAPDLARALGYDIDSALERLDDAPTPVAQAR
jgi:alkylhydroperoxidase/carboxymuconolactone decarboxylase family protein YurZ